jgi:hypothetical protein
VYQIEAAQNHRQKEILQAQYKIMTYRLWYYYHISAGKRFLRIGCYFLLT